MLSFLKEIPVVLSLRKKIFDKKFANHNKVNYFRGVFDSFAYAQASAPKTKPGGYDNEDSAKLYKERISRLYSTDYPVLFWMEKIKNDVSKVFDFGGHIGIHYYSYLKVLDSSLIHKWTVCDVDSVCREGESYAKDNDTLKKLNFVNEIEKSSGYDLFLASGSLQYLEWELHDKLQALEQRPKYIIINMTPLHRDLKTITLNNIGTAFCPYHLRKEVDFFNGLNSVGYEVISHWRNDDKSCNIAFESDRSLSYYRGAILRYKEKNEN